MRSHADVMIQMTQQKKARSLSMVLQKEKKKLPHDDETYDPDSAGKKHITQPKLL